MPEELQSLRSRMKANAQLLLVLLAVMLVIEVIDWLTPAVLDNFGIQPRRLRSLPAIVFAPFLHSGFSHLLANAIPFFMLGWLILLRGRREFVIVSLVSALVSGVTVWLLGTENSVHIGVSGVVFGYFGFLIARGVFDRTFGAMIIALVVGVLYSGLLWGLLPLWPGISWQGHLGGMIGGVLCGFLLARGTNVRFLRRASGPGKA
jgi:membrane associated rhomboid family serine protease